MKFLHTTSSLTDTQVIVWDVLSGDVVRNIKFDSPIITAAMHPRYCHCHISHHITAHSCVQQQLGVSCVAAAVKRADHQH